MLDILSTDAFFSMLQMATPLTLAAIGGVLCQRAGIVNMALEGIMLIGAFFAVFFVDAFSGNVWIGFLGSMIAGMVVSLIFGLFVIHFKSDMIITGIAINILGLGLTSFLLRVIFNQQGAVRPSSINKLRPIDIPILEDIPILGDVLSGHSIITYLSIGVTLFFIIVIYKTKFGLEMSSLGDNKQAAITAGLNTKKIEWQVILIAGALAGLAGAYLSIDVVSQFSEDMVQGRGFNAFTAVVFGNANPIMTWAATMLFGFADSIGIRLELRGIPISPSIIKMFPFLLALFALMVKSFVDKQKQLGRNFDVIALVRKKIIRRA